MKPQVEASGISGSVDGKLSTRRSSQEKKLFNMILDREIWGALVLALEISTGQENAQKFHILEFAARWKRALKQCLPNLPGLQ